MIRLNATPKINKGSDRNEPPQSCWLECTSAALALFCTIGLNINAYDRDLSRPEDFAATLTGNYRVFYLVITSLTVFATVVIQSTYAKNNRGY